MKNEQWKPVVDFESYYAVSNLGRIKRTARSQGATVGAILKPKPRKDRRWYYILYRGKRSSITRLAHRIVAAAFIGECPEGCEVNHRDGDPSNNRADNLEYITGAENKLHRYRVLGLRNPASKLTEDSVRSVFKMFERGVSQTAIGKAFNVSQSIISEILHGKRYAYFATECARLSYRGQPYRRNYLKK